MKINSHLKEELRKYLIEKMRVEKDAVKVISSYKLGHEEKQLLQNKIPKLDWKNAQFVIDPVVIAGVVITVGSRMIDLSIKGSLSNLQHIIYESD